MGISPHTHETEPPPRIRATPRTPAQSIKGREWTEHPILTTAKRSALDETHGPDWPLPHKYGAPAGELRQR